MKRGAESKHYAVLRRRVDAALLSMVGQTRPAEMRRATTHVMRAGGKRIRPVLVLLASEALGGRSGKAMHGAVAVELLHSFTLIHDDIMDHAPTRRGRPSVHALWGIDRGILAGDIILGLAYHSLLRAGPGKELTGHFTRSLLDVCEGQAVDLALQQEKGVTLRAYFSMIEKKTGSLLSLSTTLGGLIASGSAAKVQALRRYGQHLGRAFQIQDDLLDVVAEEQAFGKIVGGDILEGKKTFLLVSAMKKARGAERNILRGSQRGSLRAETRVRAVTEIYHRLGILDEARTRIKQETRLAKEAIRGLPSNRGTAMLRWIAGTLEARTF